MAGILSLLQDAASEINIQEPSAVVTATDGITKTLLRAAYRIGKKTRSEFRWPELVKLHEMTLVDGQESYAFPSDHDETTFETEWDQTNQWRLIGPYTAGQWNEIKYGITSTLPRYRFRVKGYTSKQFFINPTPGSGEAGNLVSFEYQSTSWIRPPAYATGTTYGANAYVSEDGIYYKTINGGTSSGATVATDVGVTDWATYSTPYNTFLQDTDEVLFDEETFILGVAWKFLQMKRFPYQDLMKEWNRLLKKNVTDKTAAKTIYLAPRRSTRLITQSNFPDTGYGS